uniref:Early nodulin-93-like n=1 Tax=Populus davidiana TaxID=266767 RepID=A0A6M2EUQ7_9ROSI
MGIPSELRHYWAQNTLTNQNLNHNGYDINNRRSLLIASPAEEQKILQARLCTQEGVRAGVKAAVITCVATAVPTLTAVRVIPWAKANLNYTAQALIISAASIAAYFITVDKTILECARRNAHYNKRD